MGGLLNKKRNNKTYKVHFNFYVMGNNGLEKRIGRRAVLKAIALSALVGCSFIDERTGVEDSDGIRKIEIYNVEKDTRRTLDLRILGCPRKYKIPLYFMNLHEDGRAFELKVYDSNGNVYKRIVCCL